MDKKKDGYKKIKGIGLIPKEWKVKTLGNIIDKLEAGVSVNSEDRKKTENEFGILKTSSVSYGTFMPQEHKTILAKEIERANINPKMDSIIISRMNTPALVGASAYIPKDYNDLFLPDRLWQTILKKDIDINVKWLYYILNSDKVKYKLSNIATGTSNSMKNISKPDFLNIKIPFPSLSEQKKISQIISTWDEAIDKIEDSIEDKKIIKKGLMQQLLTGNKRLKQFKEEWKEVKLKNFLKPILRAVEKPMKAYEAIGIRSHGKGTFDKYVEDPSTVAMDTLYEVKENDLIVNITFAWEAAIAIAKASDEGKLVSHRFPTYIFDISKAIPEYFKYIMIQSRFIYLLRLISPGGAGRNRVMNKTDFLKLKVKLPSVREQHAIANILTTADKEIALLEEKLEILKQQKKVLMENLLTGTVRVKYREKV